MSAIHSAITELIGKTPLAVIRKEHRRFQQAVEGMQRMNLRAVVPEHFAYFLYVAVRKLGKGAEMYLKMSDSRFQSGFQSNFGVDRIKAGGRNSNGRHAVKPPSLVFFDVFPKACAYDTIALRGDSRPLKNIINHFGGLINE